MSAVAVPHPTPEPDSFVIGEPVGRVDLWVMPVARLPELFHGADGERRAVAGSIAKLLALTTLLGLTAAAAVLGIGAIAIGLLR